MKTSCGVIVTDGKRLLLGRTTGTDRWDIPKGGTEEGEKPLDTALRELLEETGLVAPRWALRDVGMHAYLSDKRLGLFVWRPPRMPDPSTLSCGHPGTVRSGGGTEPEFDAYGLFTWAEAKKKVGRGLARLVPAMARHAGAPPKGKRPRRRKRGLRAAPAKATPT